ncbi:MAG: NifU family protein [bacterium]|nr:NifU family protein [bacterium]
MIAVETKIKEVLEKEVKPMLAMHLGSLDFIGFDKGVVSVRFQGTCKGCPLSNLTLKAGIESILKEKVKGVERVDAV